MVVVVFFIVFLGALGFGGGAVWSVVQILRGATYRPFYILAGGGGVSSVLAFLTILTHTVPYLGSLVYLITVVSMSVTFVLVLYTMREEEKRDAALPPEPSPVQLIEPPQLGPIETKAQALANLKAEFERAVAQHPDKKEDLQLLYDDEWRKIIES